ncbi:amidohydrolase family protein [bacterium]|nr:amidohydrolase family protein [bacterium]
MIIDSHYHYESRLQPVDNLIQKMDQNGIEKTVLIATLCDLLPETGELLLKLLRFFLWNKPLRSLARKLSANFTETGDLILPKKTVEIYRHPDNESVARLIKEYPDRFLGWIFLNPADSEDFLEEYEKWKDEPGFIGVKVHPFWHRYPPVKLLPVAEMLAASDKPLLAHVGFGTHGDFMPLVNIFPKLKLILAHTGFPGYRDTWKQIKNHPNIFVDTSADAYVSERFTRDAVDYLGRERVLFGTDGPYGHRLAADRMFDNGYLKRRIESLFADKLTRERILGENFRELAGIQ